MKKKINHRNEFFIISILIVILLIGFVYAFSGNIPNVTGENGSVLHFELNNITGLENDTYVYDWSGNNNNGTANNTVFQPGTGPIGDGSFYFNGVNSSINTKNVQLQTNQSFTYSVWVNAPAIIDDSLRVAVAKNSENYPYFYIGMRFGKAYFRIGNATKDRTVNQVYINDSNWHHLVGAYNGVGGMYLYVDGVLKGTSDPLAINSSRNMTIGSFSTLAAGGGIWNGSIDEVMVFNRSLSSNEVLDLYQTYEGCYPPSSGNWNLNTSLNCTFNDNYIVPANWTLTGTGKIIINGNITFSSTNQYIFANSGTQIIINKGGSLNGN